MSERGESDYVRRIQKKALKRQRKRPIFESVLSPAELDDLFILAVAEVEKLDHRIDAACEFGCDEERRQNQIYWFYWGMVERLLFSWLVDADRLDTAEFMGGSSLTQDWDYDKLWNLFPENWKTGFTPLPFRLTVRPGPLPWSGKNQ